MTLEEMREQYGGNIKLGAVDGAAFIYCGRLDELDAMELEAQVTAKLTKLIKSADRKVLVLKNTPLTFETYEENCKKKKLTPTDEGFEQWKADMQKDLEKRKRYSENLEKRFMSRPPILKREIVCRYRSCDERDTLVVIIEGKEVGSAWTTEEYITGKIGG